jgi:hypothetical protein
MTAPDSSLAGQLRGYADRLAAAFDATAVAHLGPEAPGILRAAASALDLALVAASSPALVCALCLYAETGQANPADTVIRGIAVCEPHAGYVAGGGEWGAAVDLARSQPLGADAPT